ncbi:MAG TPA: protein kinase [Chloroflexota bacterium]
MVLAALFGRRGADEARLAHVLRDVPLFRELPADDLVEIWRQLRLVEAEAGGVLCRRGDPGDRMFVVQSGEIEVRLGLESNGVVLRRAGPGDFVGEMTLLTGEPRSADMVAITDARLWALGKADFDRIAARSLPMLRVLNATLASHLARTTARLGEHASGAAGPGGLRFGPFRVLEQIGAGGMSVVYSATHVETGEAVALKVLPAAWGAAPELRARLEREAAVLGRISHPNVVRVLAVGTVEARLGGGCYIALEWLPHALDKLLRAQYPEPLAPARARGIARDVAGGLEAVHREGLIHRDVKPSNVLLRADGQPVLSDFGLARVAAGDGLERLTPSHLVVGTADYLAPEVTTGLPADARSDVYALGVTLYELLAGYVPFAGADPLETLRAHQERDPPPLPEAVPRPLRAVVGRALAKDPELRFQSAGAMARALEAAAG